MRWLRSAEESRLVLVEYCEAAGNSNFKRCRVSSEPSSATRIVRYSNDLTAGNRHPSLGNSNRHVFEGSMHEHAGRRRVRHRSCWCVKSPNALVNASFL